MDNKKDTSLADIIKKYGLKTERELNAHIQKRLNNEKVIKTLSEKSSLQAKKIVQLQQIMEIISNALNFPTKNDIANTSKLVIQSEEKIDSLEENMMQLNKSIEDVKRLLIKEEKEGINLQEDKQRNDTLILMKNTKRRRG